jgi:hypothetical protein
MGIAFLGLDSLNINYSERGFVHLFHLQQAAAWLPDCQYLLYCWPDRQLFANPVADEITHKKISIQVVY